MKFKVGDIVRPTREFIINAVESNTIHHLEYINGFEVLEIKDDRVFYYINEKDAFYKAEHLELVPEESEIKHGDIIEVSNNGEYWSRRMFIAKTDNGDFIATDCIDKNYFINGWHYMIGHYKYARKFKHQLTREQIAEKFGIDKDFIFVDE